ncbi:MAG TPA: lysylphosphatidylglycerol synthase transmembrane domain-containing protein [Anaerolineales bacterium]
MANPGQPDRLPPGPQGHRGRVELLMTGGSGASSPHQVDSAGRPQRPWLRAILWLLVVVLLALALRGVDWANLAALLSGLHPVEMGLILVVNAGVLLALSSRWWLVLRAQQVVVVYGWLSLYRLAGFAVSYFTPGPQFGGEPLLVQLLRQRHDLPASQGAASVALDKALELVVNFSFLLFGLLVVAQLGLLETPLVAGMILVAGGLVCLPLAYLLAAARGGQPLRWLLGWLPRRAQALPGWEKWQAWLAEVESSAGSVFARRPGWLVGALLASLTTWVLLVFEYWLMAGFLGFSLDPLEAVAVLTAARVAILLPLPAGLGTLEASQVLALGQLGFPAEAGLALALVIRGRDLLFGGSGLVAGALLLERH